MQRALNSAITVIISVVICWFIIPTAMISAGEQLRYSASVQISEALKGTLDTFSSKSDIKINKYPTSSSAAVYRLMNGLADIASTTRPLSFDQKEMGYVQFAFCKDPLTIIVNSKNGVRDIFENQLREIFSGKITNWKELGGADHPIVVIIPDKNSGAYKGFDYAVMKGKNIHYDLMTKKSTMVIDVVKEMQWGISFVSQGASIGNNGIWAIKIDGLMPKNDCYPYYQVFLLVTKGKPKGATKKFLDFAYSDGGKEIIKNRGMIPISNKIYKETLKSCPDLSFGH